MIENLQLALAKTCLCSADSDSLCDECDTTIYGQDEHWVRANFDRLRGLDPDLTDADDILSRGYLNWVNDRVGYALTNGFYKFTALFENDPLEATQLYIGNYVVSVTNAGEYVFLLEKGTDYEFGTRPFNGNVDYWAQDDMVANAPLMTSVSDGLGHEGEWTVDGGKFWKHDERLG